MHFKFKIHFTSLWIDFTVSQIANSYHQVAKKKKKNANIGNVAAR